MKKNIALVTLFVASLSLILLRLWGGGFTGGDDPYTAIAAIKFGGVWAASFDIASHQGRFYQLIIYPIAQIPYLIDSFAYINAWRIITSGAVVLTFFYLIKLVFDSRLAFLSIFIYLGLSETVGGGYNPFHALPLWFNTALMMQFLSYICYIKGIKTNKTSLINTAYVMYAYCLLNYEAFILFVIGYPLLYSTKEIHIGNAIERIKKIISKSLLYPLLLVLLYLLLYKVFQSYYPSSYEGSRLSIPTALDFIKVIYTLSISGIVLPSSIISLLNYQYSYNLQALLSTSLISAGFFLSLLHLRQINLSTRKIFLSMLILIIFCMLPNILLAFSEKYRNMALNGGVSFYLGGYYSAFAIAVLYALAMVLIRKFFYFSVLFGSIFLFTLVIIFFLLTYQNQYSSEQFFRLSKDESVRWKYVDEVSNLISSQNLKIHSICTNSLIEADDPNDYWSYYLSNKSHQIISLKYKKVDFQDCDAVINYHRYHFQFIDPKSGKNWLEIKSGGGKS